MKSMNNHTYPHSVHLERQGVKILHVKDWLVSIGFLIAVAGQFHLTAEHTFLLDEKSIKIIKRRQTRSRC